jgi:hexosaminidase
VAYASARHITVVPEIEMPGHAQAAVASYPELGCGPAPVDVSPRWGVHDVLFSPTETTFTFLENVLDEVLDLFDSEFIHIGGDEAVKTEWDSSAVCAERMRELGIANTGALQSYFVQRIGSFLSARGRRLIGWDEILEGGLAPDAAVMSWRGEAGGLAAAKLGHDVVMAPHEFTYLDYYQSSNWDDEPLAIGSTLTLRKAYGYEPIPAGLTGLQTRHILGAQAQIWTEYMPTQQHVETMAFPRLCALADVFWSDREARPDYEEFLTSLATHLRRLDALGVRYRPLD